MSLCRFSLFTLGLWAMMFFSASCLQAGNKVSVSKHIPVTQAEMAQVYEAARTPYKYGLVISPSSTREQIDCPSVFRKDGQWYMTYVLYNGSGGQDGKGYETWLATSQDLLHWETLGRVLEYPSDTARWDACQRGGFPALQDWNWGGSYELQSYKGKNYMTYIGGHGAGYEAINEPLSIGLAWTNSDLLTTPHDWESYDSPILSYRDKDAGWWEQMTQYKSLIYWDKTKSLGAPFVMFYNAGGRNPANQLKGERIGIALSHNMKRWKRYKGNPIFTHEEPGVITGDAQIVRMDDLYVMFYFSAFRPEKPYKAYNTFACSRDLIHWEDWQGEDLIYPSKDYDNLFAHKSCVIYHNGVVYHFYCAVNEHSQRGIAVATSRPMGKSSVSFPHPPVPGPRKVIDLSEGWETCLVAVEGKDAPDPTLAQTRRVTLPHNWDDYYGARQLTHGNLHGTALYKRSFHLENKRIDKRYFLYLEGLGSYGTVILNQDTLCRRTPMGRLTTTLDATASIREGNNQLTILCHHPSMITDMPWVCGGCSSEWGFSEGSQPLGIFRPVSLEITDPVRIEPFGVHVWNNLACDSLFVETEITNHSALPVTIELQTRLNDADGIRVFKLSDEVRLAAGETRIIRQQQSLSLKGTVHLWSPTTPYLYKMRSLIRTASSTLDEVRTRVGIRTASWPCLRGEGDYVEGDHIIAAGDRRFFLNGQPTLIHGTCEYEHILGQSHAFDAEEIRARAHQIKTMGFNAQRDAHQPHNLRYQDIWDAEGILWWPQFSAHIWYDTPTFRTNFKKMLRQWVKERRNNPSNVLWGLQNESTLPPDFASECVEIIRELDPTVGTMRAVTTCNGGRGTHWNVVQNWSGTYGGKLENYGYELSRPDQLLNGEYGAWRTFGLHTEPSDTFVVKGQWSEERFCQLLHSKVSQTYETQDSLCGQYQWIFNSHDNPGRRQPDEAYRMIDKVGPYNYKGILTAWGQPSDAYYMYQAASTSPKKCPMIYLASHTWTDRFSQSGPRRATIEVYSNVEQVYLVNTADLSALESADFDLSVLTDKGISCAVSEVSEMGRHRFRDFLVESNVLTAVAVSEVRGQRRIVAHDFLHLEALPDADGVEALYRPIDDLLRPTAVEDSLYYLYRINCGGDAVRDNYGRLWTADDTLISRSWSSLPQYADVSLSPVLASQGETSDPILNAHREHWPILGTYRWGRHALSYHLPVMPHETYRVELYLLEPWWGTSLAEQTDCEGYRLLDIAIEGDTVCRNLDIWAHAGHDCAMRLTYAVRCDADGILDITFPRVRAGQAIISAIAVAGVKSQVTPILPDGNGYWQKITSVVAEKMPAELLPTDHNTREAKTYLPQLSTSRTDGLQRVTWEFSVGLAQEYAFRFRYKNLSASSIACRWRLLAKVDGREVCSGTLSYPTTPAKWRMLSITTGTFVNAGDYRLILEPEQEDVTQLEFENLSVQ